MKINRSILHDGTQGYHIRYHAYDVKNSSKVKVLKDLTRKILLTTNLQSARIDGLKDDIKNLTETIKDLREKLKKGSSNT